MSGSSTTIGQSAAARDGLFLLLEGAFVIAFVRGVPGAATTAGAIAAGVFTSACFIGLALLWRATVKNRRWLDISDEAIELRTNRGVRATMSRRDGDELRFVMRGSYRAKNLTLVHVATNASMTLPYYSRKPIAAACATHGWQVL